MTAALHVSLHIRFHAVPKHVETNKGSQDFQGAAVAMGAVQMLEQRQPEDGE